MKKLNAIVVGVWCALSILASCTKGEKPADDVRPKKLEAVIKFVEKPDPDIEFFLNLYYAETANEAFYDKPADQVLKKNLSQDDIANGITLVFDDMKESDFVFVTAFVDVDGSGDLSEGDIATAYYGNLLQDVMNGKVQANNVATRQSITLTLDEVYTTKGKLNVDFTFPLAETVAGTSLTFELYYAQEEEPRFFDREADMVRNYTLTPLDIVQGYRMEVGGIDSNMPYVYGRAYLDVDDDGQLSYGDIAVVYDGKSFKAIEDGTLAADNIHGKSTIIMSMNQWYSEEMPLLPVSLYFPDAESIMGMEDYTFNFDSGDIIRFPYQGYAVTAETTGVCNLRSAAFYMHAIALELKSTSLSSLVIHGKSSVNGSGTGHPRTIGLLETAPSLEGPWTSVLDEVTITGQPVLSTSCGGVKITGLNVNKDQFIRIAFQAASLPLDYYPANLVRSASANSPGGLGVRVSEIVLNPAP